jgi:hypothetical protein
MRSALVLLPLFVAVAVSAQAPPTVPVNNRPGIEEPPRPALSDLTRRMSELFAALADDDVARAERAVFLPREAFRQIKGVSAPDRIFDRLLRELGEDVHRIHAELPASAVVERVQLRNCKWVAVREEANRLPYWRCLHNRVHYRVGERRAFLVVRTLIGWDETWYVTHLAEASPPASARPLRREP